MTHAEHLQAFLRVYRQRVGGQAVVTCSYVELCEAISKALAEAHEDGAYDERDKLLGAVDNLKGHVPMWACLSRACGTDEALFQEVQNFVACALEVEFHRGRESQ